MMRWARLNHCSGRPHSSPLTSWPMHCCRVWSPSPVHISSRSMIIMRLGARGSYAHGPPDETPAFARAPGADHTGRSTITSGPAGGRQQLCEIRAEDLRFTSGETRLLLQQILGPEVTEEIAALLEGSTEGWAVGLRLAALSLRSRQRPCGVACALKSPSWPSGHRAIPAV